MIIDGHHLMYRAYYAIPKTLRTSSGEQTNAVFGVASMLLMLLKAEAPDSLVFCFDAGEETFRHKENATYKEGRAETPDDFYLQIPRILELIDAFSFEHVSDPRYEADDFLCAYARAAEGKGMRVTIVTGDRDAFQLASPNVRIAIPHKGYQQPEYLGPTEILTKYGVRPDQVPSYKGLMGDASDNLPGVVGIGPKGASKLLQEFDTLQGIYENIEKVPAKVREKLERDREQAFFCERMATLLCDIELPAPLASLALKDVPAARAEDFFRSMEFTLLLKRFTSLLDTPYGKEHFARASHSSSQPVHSWEKPQLSLFS
ncbi:MAG: 5'-3' exonuclease H3TH domain-containing protein [Candidatus Peregrinibacteria bacterium]|nr:5'-3' exonuclease H3TH domain-containing protein [Candidatus Peregrinibacteria bacterium]